jgi:hypothetical protein
MELLINNLPGEFSEENQQVAMKRERQLQLLLFIHLLFARSHFFPTTVTFS